MPKEVLWPTQWRLPFGYLVKIRRIGAPMMKRVMGGPGYRGGWTHFTNKVGTIYICTNTPVDDQLDTLSHEMRHALTDWDAVVQDMRERVMEERLREKIRRELDPDHDASAEKS